MVITSSRRKQGGNVSFKSKNMICMTVNSHFNRSESNNLNTSNSDNEDVDMLQTYINELWGVGCNYISPLLRLLPNIQVIWYVWFYAELSIGWLWGNLWVPPLFIILPGFCLGFTWISPDSLLCVPVNKPPPEDQVVVSPVYILESRQCTHGVVVVFDGGLGNETLCGNPLDLYPLVSSILIFFLRSSISNPMKSHIHSFWSTLFYCIICNSHFCWVICLNGCWFILRVSHFS